MPRARAAGATAKPKPKKTLEKSASVGASRELVPMPEVLSAIEAEERPDGLKIVAWNVNGLRALLRCDDYLTRYVEAERPDVLCLSETKMDEAGFAELGELLPGYRAFHSPCLTRRGYSGTAVFSLVEPVEVSLGMGVEKHDQEGRLITLEFNDFFLVHTYVPNSGQKLDRLDYRTDEWEVDFLQYLQRLEQSKPVVWTGDLNVAHQEIDIHNPKGNQRTAGFTPRERARFGELLDAGFVDTWRAANPEEQQFSYWSYRFNARGQNKGWRLDYVVVSQALADRVNAAFIRADMSGSDHVPVGVVLSAT